MVLLMSCKIILQTNSKLIKNLSKILKRFFWRSALIREGRRSASTLDRALHLFPEQLLMIVFASVNKFAKSKVETIFFYWKLFLVVEGIHLSEIQLF